MAENKIQIRRSIANGNVTGLSNGELAYTLVSNTLWIGSPQDGTAIPIAGVRNPGTLTANQALVANATSEIDKIKVANAVITSIWANGNSGSNGQVLVSNGTAIYWGTGTSGSNTYVQFNDSGVANGVAGFAFDKVSNKLLVSNTVNAAIFSIGTSFTANSSNLVFTNGGITANAFFGNGASVTSVNAATVGGNSASDLRGYANDAASNAYSNAMSNTLSRDGAYTGNNTFSNVTNFSGNVNFSSYIASNVQPYQNNAVNLGSTSLRWANVYSNNVIANNGSFDGNVTITGDLTVSGNVTTVDVQSIKVGDPLIYLASNNNSTDTLDIGFVGQYNKSSEIRNAGLFRDHTDDTFKLFSNLVYSDLASNNNIDTGGTGYTVATLETYLSSGGLTTNAGSIAITANSSVNVSIFANTLTLSSPLAGNSGGTGLNSYSNNDLLIANSTNGFKTLSFNSNTGYVLQSNGTALVYDVLDGGTF
jgi:hypothetical protein